MKKKREIVLAEMAQKKSQYGNTFYRGKSQEGIQYVMVEDKTKKSRQGEPIWTLMITN